MVSRSNLANSRLRLTGNRNSRLLNQQSSGDIWSFRYQDNKMERIQKQEHLNKEYDLVPPTNHN